MKIIYTAGPIRHEGSWENTNEIHANIELARMIARKLWVMGWSVICPHANTEFMDGPDIPCGTFINGDLEIISRCDAIYMLPDWESSNGAKMEHRKATELGIPIYYNLGEVPHEKQ
jgi:hypothetical protein